jgi:hypothetical protein
MKLDERQQFEVWQLRLSICPVHKHKQDIFSIKGGLHLASSQSAPLHLGGITMCMPDRMAELLPLIIYQLFLATRFIDRRPDARHAVISRSAHACPACLRGIRRLFPAFPQLETPRLLPMLCWQCRQRSSLDKYLDFIGLWPPEPHPVPQDPRLKQCANMLRHLISM